MSDRGDPGTSRRAQRARGQGTLAFVIVVAVVVAGVALDRLGARDLGETTPEAVAVTGSWFCPHGGGRDWSGWILVANPDDTAVQVRVTSYGEDGQVGEPQSFDLAGRATQRVDVPANQLGSGSLVEVFGGRGAAGWVIEAMGEAQGAAAQDEGGTSSDEPTGDASTNADEAANPDDSTEKDEKNGNEKRNDNERNDQGERAPRDDGPRAQAGASGVSAEPCLDDAGSSFLLPDGATPRGEDAYVIVLNPFDANAVFTLTLQGSGDAVTTPEEVIRPHHATAVRLADTTLGAATLAVRADASVGRIAVSTMTISQAGGLRSSVGMQQVPDAEVVLPSGQDEGTTDLVVWNPAGGDPVSLQATVLGKEGARTAAGAQNEEVADQMATTFNLSTLSPSAIVVGPPGLVAARRTHGVEGDVGVTTGGPVRGGAWVVLPATTPDHAEARLMLANRGGSPIEVQVTPLTGGTAATEATTVTIPANGVVLGPPSPSEVAVLVEPTDGGAVVPVFASYSGRGTGYAVTAGIPIDE